MILLRSLCFYLFLFCQIIWINASFANQQKIVLLTSLDPQTISGFPLLKKKYIPDLENIFRERFSHSCFQVEILRNADQADLWNALHDPQNVAVYWLSHVSASPQNGMLEFMSCGEILDSNGFDVSPLFPKVHPNLRVLGVVGCNSLKVLRNFDFPDSLEVFGFKTNIDAKAGLKSILDKSSRILENPAVCGGYSSEYPAKQIGYSVLIKRFFSSLQSIRPAARIVAGDNILGVFPKGKDGEIYQLGKFFIPQKACTNALLPNIKIDLGHNAKVQTNFLDDALDIGTLNLTLIDKTLKNPPIWNLWDLFHSPHGKPLGVSLNIYKFQQSALFEQNLCSYLTEESEFLYEPMPPY